MDGKGKASLLRLWDLLGLYNCDDFFIDKKFNGLFLPVVHVAVQLVCVHSWKEENLSSNETDSEGRTLLLHDGKEDLTVEMLPFNWKKNAAREDS